MTNQNGKGDGDNRTPDLEKRREGWDRIWGTVSADYIQARIDQIDWDIESLMKTKRELEEELEARELA